MWYFTKRLFSGLGSECLALMFALLWLIGFMFLLLALLALPLLLVLLFLWILVTRLLLSRCHDLLLWHEPPPGGFC